MKLSVITWDASFRESFHTIKSFGNQLGDDSEFIWVENYEVCRKAKQIIDRYSKCRYLELKAEDNGWHLGQCINAGVNVAEGEILVIPDGDIEVSEDFLAKVKAEMIDSQDLVLYYRRYDEIRNGSSQIKSGDGEGKYRLVNPTNYAGCVVMHKKMFIKINGFEEHICFSGPGVNGMEMFVRLRNAGAKIKWCVEKIFHPWHEATGSSSMTREMRSSLRQLGSRFGWLIPYAGVAQSWVIHSRSLSLSSKSSIEECNHILADIPDELKEYVYS
ncbi:MAG: glycosyltransferase [Gammaproteobacteria bacterium]|nr:glycosyltransferase [Gammaproteobacteria bacterium]